MRTLFAACLITASSITITWAECVDPHRPDHRSRFIADGPDGQWNPEAMISVRLPEDEPDTRTGEMETLSRSHSRSGGYGALVFKGSTFRDASILIMGVRGAWLVNQAVGLGLDLNGIVPTATFDDVDPGGIHLGILTGGYGGLLLEPVVWSNKMVHVTFPFSLGAGWLGYIEDWEYHQYDYHGDLYDQDVFWYVEPGVQVEINVTRFFRIDAGVSKRFSQDLNLINTPSDAFDKINYVIVLKFGGF